MSLDGRPWLKAANVLLHSGSYGVDLFFTLSAYLITEILLRERDRAGAIDVRAFYIRRVLRIWPLYFAFLGLMLISHTEVPRVFYVSSSLFVGNFFFSSFDALTPAVAMWSISVEEQFYLAWPAVVRLCRDRQRLIVAAIFLWLFAVVARAVLSAYGVNGLDLWFNSVSHLDSIAAGVLLAVVGVGNFRHKGVAMFGLGATLWLISSWLALYEFGRGTLTAFALIAPGSLLMVAGAIGNTGILRWRPIVYLGRISYGLYIFHNAILRTCIQALGHTSWLIPPVALAMTIVVAAVSYKYFEAPFLRLKARFQRVRSGDGGGNLCDLPETQIAPLRSALS